MHQSGFSVERSIAFLLGIVLLCWTGAVAPAMAQPLLPLHPVPLATLEMAMSKPLFSFSGKRPTNLGVTDGKLADCPGTPNCVNSQAPDTDVQHKIAPLSYTKSPTEAMTALKGVIQGMKRTQIIREDENYLYVEFTSALMGYVDDVEFLVDPSAKVIHVRSASRLGQSDLGVNRKRIEEIRAKFVQKNV
jgi:uncharacterized protein (DUF1499 family)